MKSLQTTFAASLLLFLFFGLNAKAAQGLSKEQMKSLIGVYQGGDAAWMQNPSSEIKCQVSISVNNKNQVVVTLKHKEGIHLYSRQTLDSNYTDHVLPEITHPLQGVSQFMKKTWVNDGDFSNNVEGGSLKISDTWHVRMAYLDKPYGFVQMSYNKSDRFAFYNSTLSYIPDLNGCYGLRKVQ